MDGPQYEHHGTWVTMKNDRIPYELHAPFVALVAPTVVDEVPMTFEDAVSFIVSEPSHNTTMAVAASMQNGRIDQMFRSAVASLKKQDSDGQSIGELLYIAAIAVRAGRMSNPPAIPDVHFGPVQRL